MTPKSLQSRLKIAKNAKFGSTESNPYLFAKAGSPVGSMSASTPRYPDLFREFVVNNMGSALSRIDSSTGAVLTEEERERALHSLDFGLTIDEAWTLARKLLLTMAPKMEQAGFRDDWIPYLQQGIVQSRTLRDDKTRSKLYFHLGVLYQLRGRLDDAHHRFILSASGFEALDDSHNQAKALNRLAYIARLQRKPEEATRLVVTALKLLDEEAPERAYSYFVQGTIAYDALSWTEAADLFQRSLTLWQQEGNTRMVAWNLTNLGTTMRPLGRYAEAIRYYELAIALFEEIHDPVHQAVASMNLGNVYLVLEQPADALTFFQPAERVFRQVQDERRLAIIYSNQGIAYHGLQQWDQAEQAFLSSIERWQQTNDIHTLIDVYCDLGLTYFDQGQHLAAKEQFRIAQDHLTKIAGEPGYRQLHEMIMRYLRQSEDIAE
ncbi:tetratricopeptide repeat protein [Chloroflexi bacterium TSY]|nr:tetratricopeptide repeat protein [Chloroflexi bacterium TSY]